MIHERDKIIGSGGSFLSNEIFYRVSLLRNSHNPTLKSGHLHVPILKDTFNTEKVLSETTKLLEYALKKL